MPEYRRFWNRPLGIREILEQPKVGSKNQKTLLARESGAEAQMYECSVTAARCLDPVEFMVMQIAFLDHEIELTAIADAHFRTPVVEQLQQ